MNNINKFHGHEIAVIDSDGEYWMTAEQIGECLEYKQPRTSILRIFNRNKKLFEGYSGVVKLTTPGGAQETRIFNQKGIIALTMKSNQDVAIPFQRWAVDILDQYQKGYIQKLKRQNSIIWQEARRSAADGYKNMCEALYITRKENGQEAGQHIYNNESKMVNFILSGRFKSMDRDNLDEDQLSRLKKIERMDEILILRGMDYHQRKKQLSEQFCSTLIAADEKVIPVVDLLPVPA